MSRSTCSSCARSPPRSRAGRCRRRRSARPRPVPPSAAPETAVITRATLIRAQPLPEPGERWLRSADLAAEADRAIAVLNRVLHAQRVAAGDPALPMVTRGRVLAIRVGVGAGEQVADGRWASAALVPAPVPGRGSRTAGLRPTERFAAIDAYTAGWPEGSVAHAQYFVAMLEWQRGRKEEANRSYAKGTQLQMEVTKSMGDWNRRATIELLRREAEGLVQQTAETSDVH